MTTTIKPRTEEVVLYQGDDLERLDELLGEVSSAASQSGPRLLGEDDSTQEAAKAYDDFVTEATERAVKVRIKALPRKVFREFVAKHPPRPENEDDKGWGFNFESLADDLVAPCIDGPVFSTETEREAFLDGLSDADFSRLYSAALKMNRGATEVPKAGLSSRLARISGATSKSLED